MVALKLTQIGNATGLLLPREVQARLNVGVGDTVFLTEAADGYRLTPYSPDFETQTKAARALMERRRNALRELAR